MTFSCTCYGCHNVSDCYVRDYPSAVWVSLIGWKDVDWICFVCFRQCMLNNCIVGTFLSQLISFPQERANKEPDRKDRRGQQWLMEGHSTVTQICHLFWMFFSQHFWRFHAESDVWTTVFKVNSWAFFTLLEQCSSTVGQDPNGVTRHNLKGSGQPFKACVREDLDPIQ